MLRSLEKSPALALAIAATALAGVIALDLVTGLEFGMAPLYMLPVALAAWYCRRGGGLGMAAVGALCISLIERVEGRPHVHTAAPYWNGLAAFCSLAVTAELVVRWRRAMSHERDVARLKGTMLSLASHEFNNALSILGGSIAMLEDERDPGRRRELCEMLERVHSTLKQTTENFLNEARLDTGRFEVKPRPVDVAKTVSDYLPVALTLASQKDVEVRVQAPESCVAVADADALMLVVSNLVGNAIKYTPTRGRVDVRVAPGAGDVVVCVSDTGIGISKESLEKLAHGPFRSPRGKAMAKGYGLGLMITRKILEAHGSVLEIESEPGRGSSFRFRLPLAALGH